MIDLPKPIGPIASDHALWQAVRDLYDVESSLINLENGFWGVMAKPVLADYLRLTEQINRENTVYARARFSADWQAARTAVAGAAGFDPADVALTRGASEALQILISNYNRLHPGDAVLYSDLDYESAQYAMDWLAGRRGVSVVKITLPDAPSKQAAIEAYAQAMAETPKLKLILLTHICHRTGLVLPVQEIAALARAKGIDVILDAAHSWGQVDFNPADLGIDFIAFNLHKWIGAPIGLGFLYEARKLDHLTILTPDEAGMSGGITAFRLHGQTTPAEANALVARLRDQHGILTVSRLGLASGACIRVTPALYTSESDVLALAAALKAITRAL